MSLPPSAPPLLAVSDVAEATLELARELAVSGGLMILGVAAVNWLVSSDAREYLQRVSDAQLMRGRMKHRCAGGGGGGGGCVRTGTK